MKSQIEDKVIEILEKTKEPTAGLVKDKLKQMGCNLSYDSVSNYLNLMASKGIIGRKTVRDFVGAVDGKKHYGWHYYKLRG